MFVRRPAWEHLRKTGLSLGPEHFTISRRPILFGGETHQPGVAVPMSMAIHRIRQMYRMRLLDALPEVVGLLHRARTRPEAVSVPTMSPVAEVSPITMPTSFVPVDVEPAAVAEVVSKSGYQPSREKRGRRGR